MTGIYKITNKLNNKIYIGQSVNIKRRWQEHIYDNRKNSLIHLAIQKYGKDNFDFEVIELCEQKELDTKEQYWINYYQSFDKGYNLTRGGNSGFYYDIEAIYEDYLHTQNIAQTAKNVGCHINTVRRIVRIFGVNHSEQQIEKAVEQIDCQTLKVIKTYDSIKDAADAMGVVRDAIAMAANGTHNSSAGYYWRFVGDEKQFNKEIKQWKKAVQQFTLDNVLIATFESTAAATRSLGKDGKNGGSVIGAVCRGTKKSAYGYKWKYAE